jgi:GT2 family glycosyltransferase
MHSDISVIICAYSDERWDVLLEAVDSVRCQTVTPRELILVIDHNPQLLVRARQALPDVIVTENRGERGLSGARNTGLVLARAEIVAFLDDDALAAPEWLQQLLAGYADPAVAGVGGKIVPLWPGRRPAWFPAEFDWVVGCSYTGLPEQPADVRNLIGCNMSFRRQVFAAIGNFHLGYGCDETEFCIRLRRQWPARKLLYQPQALVQHHIAPGRTAWQHFYARCYFEGGSKAVVAWLQGPRAGLASERAYTLRTLPRGVWQGVMDTLTCRRPGGLARAGAIIFGLGATTLGYGLGSLRVREAARRRGWREHLEQEAAS